MGLGDDGVAEPAGLPPEAGRRDATDGHPADGFGGMSVERCVIRNLTAHDVVLYDGPPGDQEPVSVFRPGGPPARCSVSVSRLEPLVMGDQIVPVCEEIIGEIVDLPPSEPGVWLIVSRIVRDASDRDDLLTPADLVRDRNGVVVGCRALARRRRNENSR